MSIRKMFAGVTLLLAMFVAGCASVPMASEELDRQAKTFAVPFEMSNIYVYHSEGAASKQPILLKGKVVGELVSKTYLVLKLDPGSYALTSKGSPDSTLTLKTEKGKSYFVSAGSKLQQVDDATGKKAVGESMLIDRVK